MRRSLKRLVLLLASSVALLGLSSCTDSDHVLSPFTDAGDVDVVDDLGSISGLVVNVTGSPVASARLEVRDSQTGAVTTGFSDLGGRFFLAGLELDGDAIRFSAAPQLFNQNYRSLRLTPGGELHFPRVMLLPVVRGPVFFATQAAAANIGSLGSRVEFPELSFVAADSTLYTERVAPYLAVTTASDAHFAAAFPGEFSGILDDGEQILIDPLGVIWVHVDSQAGQMQLAPDVDITYRLAVDTSNLIDLPEDILVWVLDRWEGTWDQAGEASLSDGAYEVSVPSLGPIAWASPAGSMCEVSGTVLDNLGEPLAGVNVDYRDLSGRFRGNALTDEDGGFFLPVRPSAGALLTPYLGSIIGTRDTVDTIESCPLVLAEPLQITLPSYQIDLNWDAPDGDLDAYYRVFISDEGDLKLQWVIDFINRGRLDLAPYVVHEGDARGNAGPETIIGRRWYDGKTEYWVRDYANGRTDALRTSGAVVDLAINEEQWQFSVADAPFDEATADTSGWWHVFDILIDGADVSVEPRQLFAPAPRLRP